MGYYGRVISEMKKRILLIVASIIVFIGLLSLAFLASATDATDPNLQIAAIRLSLKESVHVQYGITGTSFEGVKLLVWTEPQTIYEYGTQNTVLEPEGNSSGYLVFDYPVYAKQLGANIYTRAYVEKSGTAYYSNVKKYSVLQYVYNMTGKTGNVYTGSDAQELFALLDAILDYGSAAQTYLNYKPD